MSSRIALIAAGIALAGLPLSAHAQQVIGSGQTFVGQIAVPGGGTLTVQQGGTVTNAAGAAVIDLTNGTTITVRNDGTIAATGAGFDAIDALGSTLILFNTGTISGADEAVVADSIISLINSGTISGVNNGVLIAGPITRLENSGTISGGNNDGILGGAVASLINSGTIRAGDEGIDIDSGNVVNTGSGLIEGGDSGIEFDRDNAGNASVDNAGRIRSTAGPGGIAIDFQGTGLDRLTVRGRSTIEGVINWDGLGDTFVVRSGRSSALTFTDNDSGVGDPPTVFAIDTGGLPFVVQRTAAPTSFTATTRVVVVDPTSFSLADSTLVDITGGISRVLTSQADTARDIDTITKGGSAVLASANGTSMMITPVADHGPVLRAWAEVFGGWRGEESDGNRLAYDHVFGGAMAGIETDTASDNTRVGFFVGGSGSKIEVDFGSQDTEIGSIFGGLYVAHQAGDIAIDAAVTVGLADYDQRRFMNDNTVAGGVDTANADYYGIFVSPEITVSSSLAVTNWMAVKPSLTLRYAGLFLDGYTEKDSKANLTVDDRDVHVISARAQVAVPVHMSMDYNGRLTTEFRIGAEGRATVSEDKVRATILGQNLNFAPGGDDEVLTGFAGAAFTYVMISGTRLYGNIEAGYGTDEAAHVTGRAGVKVPF